MEKKGKIKKEGNYRNEKKTKKARVGGQGGSPSEEHNPPRGSPRKYTFLEVSAGGALRGFCRALRGSARVHGIFRGQWPHCL